MHSRGNIDQIKVAELNTKLSGNKNAEFTNVHFISVGSPKSPSTMQEAVNKLGGTYEGMFNHYTDPVGWGSIIHNKANNSSRFHPVGANNVDNWGLGDHDFKDSYWTNPELIKKVETIMQKKGNK